MKDDDNIIPFEELGLRCDLETGNSDLTAMHERTANAVRVIREIQYIAEQWEEGLIDDDLVPQMYQAFVERIEDVLYITGPSEECTDPEGLD